MIDMLILTAIMPVKNSKKFVKVSVLRSYNDSDTKVEMKQFLQDITYLGIDGYIILDKDFMVSRIKFRDYDSLMHMIPANIRSEVARMIGEINLTRLSTRKKELFFKDLAKTLLNMGYQVIAGSEDKIFGSTDIENTTFRVQTNIIHGFDIIVPYTDNMVLSIVNSQELDCRGFTFEECAVRYSKRKKQLGLIIYDPLSRQKGELFKYSENKSFLDKLDKHAYRIISVMDKETSVPFAALGQCNRFASYKWRIGKVDLKEEESKK